MLKRVPTAFDDRIYGPDWRAWVDPEVPDEIAPTALLLDRHLGTPVEHKTALIVDGEAITYGALARLVATVSTALVGRGVVPEDRVWPRRTLIVGTGVVLGGLIGLFLALGHNMWARYSRVAQPT